MPKRKVHIVEERMAHCPYCDRVLILRVNAVKPTKEFMEMRRRLAKEVDKIIEAEVD